MADLLGLDRSTYSYYELGKIKPDIKTIMRLSDIFNVHYTTILESEDSNAFLDTRKSAAQQDFGINEKNLEVPTTGNLTRKEQNILMTFRLLSEQSQKDAIEFISTKFKNDRDKIEN